MSSLRHSTAWSSSRGLATWPWPLTCEGCASLASRRVRLLSPLAQQAERLTRVPSLDDLQCSWLRHSLQAMALNQAHHLRPGGPERQPTEQTQHMDAFADASRCPNTGML